MWTYRFIRFVTFPLYWAALKIRNRENHPLFYEKMGHPTENRPKGDVIWTHVNNFDEADELVRNIQAAFPGTAVLLTYNTRNPDSRNHYGAGVICQAAPLDVYAAVRNFLRFWEPRLAIRNRAEIRPYQLLLLKKFDIPNFLVNGEISDKAYRRWKWAIKVARAAARNITFAWAKNNKQTLRLANLGAVGIENQELVMGNSKIKEILSRIKQQLK